VMIEAALTASEGRAAATMDFPGAFLQATMPSDQAVFVRVPKDLATVLHMAYPEVYGSFYSPGQRWLFVRLRKAMYGCVQSALLWYQEFVKIFESLGFKVNPYERCVLNRFGPQGRITVLVHVDDAFVTAPSEQHIDRLVTEIQKLYPQLTVHRGKKLPYLGMVIDLSKPGEAVLSMEKYVQDLVENCGFDGVAASPATANLFTVDTSSPPLSPEMALQFHSGIAKVLRGCKPRWRTTGRNWQDSSSTSGLPRDMPCDSWRLTPSRLKPTSMPVTASMATASLTLAA